MSATVKNPSTRPTRPSTSSTVKDSGVQRAVKGQTAVAQAMAAGTVAWVRQLVEQARQIPFDATDAFTVEPLPVDSDWLQGSTLIGVTFAIDDVAFGTKDYGNGPVKCAELTIYIADESRPENAENVGKRKVRMTSRRALAQCMSLYQQAQFPVLATIEQDEPAFPGGTPGNMLARPRDVPEIYYHAPWGEAGVNF